MFGIGVGELLVIAIVALVVFGPNRLPDIMRRGGKLFVQARRMSTDFRSSFDQMIREAEQEVIKEEREQIQKLLDATVSTKLAEAKAEGHLGPAIENPQNLPVIETQEEAPTGSIADHGEDFYTVDHQEPFRAGAHLVEAPNKSEASLNHEEKKNT